MRLSRIIQILGIVLFAPWASVFSQEPPRASANQVVAFAVNRSSSALLRSLIAQPPERIVPEKKVTIFRARIRSKAIGREETFAPHVDSRMLQEALRPASLRDEPMVLTVTD